MRTDVKITIIIIHAFIYDFVKSYYCMPYKKIKKISIEIRRMYGW